MKRLINKYSRVSIILMLSLGILACHDKPKPVKKKTHIIVVKKQAVMSPLFYKGILAPRESRPVLSPEDGRVTHLFFKYGESVKKHQRLLAIKATTLSKDYRTAVTGYLTKKSAYESAIKSFQGDKALFKAGVISQETYSSGKNSFQNATLGYYQARYQLKVVLKKAGLPERGIEALTFANPKKINKILQRHFKETRVDSPGVGVILYPIPDSDGSSSSSKGGGSSGGKLSVGVEVKQGQLLVSLGDLSGYRIDFKVGEVNIDSVAPGLKATITGTAFPGIVLKGHVVLVASQADPSQGGGAGAMSVFSAQVEVPKVTAAQTKRIRVGMSAKVEIDIPSKLQILLPLSAVYQKHGRAMVTIVNKKTGHHESVPVMTGKTTLTGVVILQGINPGDKVVVHD